MRIWTSLTGAVAAAALAASPASAEMKTALTGAEIAALLTDAGLEATLTEDARTGTPVAQGQIGSYIFVVRGMECSGAPTACGALLFFANFGMGAAPSQADFEAVNRFNDSQLYGRAYIIASRNEVGVDYVIELDGGVSMDNLSRNVARWADVVGAFVAHMSGGGEPTS